MDASFILAGRQPNFLAAMDAGTAAAQRQYDFGRQQQYDQLSQQHGPGIMAGEPGAMNALAQFDYGAGLDAQNTRQGLEIDRERIEIMRAEAGRQAQEWARTVSQDEAAKEREQALQMLMPMAPAVMQAIQGDTSALDALAQENGMDPDELFGMFMTMDAAVDALGTMADLQPDPVAPKVGAIPEGSYMVDPNDPAKGMAPIPGYSAPNKGWRPATPEELAMYGANAGQVSESGEFRPINPPSGTSIQTNPDGTMTFSQGPGVKPLTEAQGKDNVFATRAEGALVDLEPVAGALTNFTEQSMGIDPTGMVRQYQSDEYQTAKNAGDEFLTAILRKDTGAAITTQEQSIYGDTYLPQPGDGPAVLEQKKKARARAVEALKSGMDQRQIAMTEKALVDAAARVEKSSQVYAPPDIDPEDWKYMTPEQRALFGGGK